jgi:large subunit ribosomal protein L17
MGFTNIANTVSANQDEEVWVELHSYIDHKQLDDVSAKMEKDESAGQLYKKFTDLITPESCIEGQFSRIGV